MSVWVYTNGDIIKVFASADVARLWFAKHDPEGVAWEYTIIGK